VSHLLPLSAFFVYIFFCGVRIIIPKTLVISASAFVWVSGDISASFKPGLEWKIGGGPEDLWLSDGIS